MIIVAHPEPSAQVSLNCHLKTDCKFFLLLAGKFEEIKVY